ncbi:hypothetical protein [Sphingomonas sp.]|jgi:hypothetical protein|uniref:hypothetical protein n=1 Tax=Sphingomonas sp. TaxID=28214 RepID=UPI0026241C73|nr:hypothetical protein [Sphingomonas sp.]MDF2494967.1 hypothetical protein [Sphingomonas sp.]
MKRAVPPSQAMQRVRVGMVGLAAVVLLIGLASALFNAASREQPVVAAPRVEEVANTTSPANVAAPAVPDDDNEPLAQLGVAPSATETGRAPAEPRP